MSESRSRHPLPHPARYLTERQVAPILQVTPRCLQAWRQRGEGPPWHRMGRLVRYREDAVLEWAQRQRQPSGCPI